MPQHLFSCFFSVINFLINPVHPSLYWSSFSTTFSLLFNNSLIQFSGVLTSSYFLYLLYFLIYPAPLTFSHYSITLLYLLFILYSLLYSVRTYPLLHQLLFDSAHFTTPSFFYLILSLLFILLLHLLFL